MQLVYYFKSRRKAADAVRALSRSPVRDYIERLGVLIETGQSIFIVISFASVATETDRVRVEGILAAGQPSTRDFSELMTSLKSYREIYIGEGAEMFRGHGWGSERR
jgi:hypothetical protein